MRNDEARVAADDREFSERWLESRRRARQRRSEAARAATRRRISSRGVATVAAVMALGAGGAMAANTGGAAPTAAPAAVLHVGSAGAAVQALQRALGVTADGAFGPLTARALRRYQRAHGIPADGVAGPAPRAARGSTAQQATAAKPAAPILARIALCESGGNPAAVSAGGQYRGKYQFTRATWRALGGKGDPAKAPEAEQDRLAAALYAAQGTTPWPVCGAS